MCKTNFKHFMIHLLQAIDSGCVHLCRSQTTKPCKTLHCQQAPQLLQCRRAPNSYCMDNNDDILLWYNRLKVKDINKVCSYFDRLREYELGLG